MQDNDNVRVRFAPSPTGKLHLGSARTALFNFLFAKQHNGKFILRIEDTDIERSSRQLEKSIIDELQALDIYWSEGPDIGGSFAPYRQSERFNIYKGYANQMLAEKNAYYCYCTPEQLEEDKKRMLAARRMPKYSGRCSKLTENEAKELGEKIKPAIRFKIPDYNIEFEDGIRGKVKIEKTVLGDFIILKSDGSPTYNFAAAIDDALMSITHVIRGEDHLTNTTRQIYIYDVLSLNIPRFTHIGMILGPDKAKLSKRHGAESVGSYLEKGFLPEAMVNYLVLLGWSDAGGQEFFHNIEEIIKRFDDKRLSPSPSIFDMDKFLWLNGEHIRNKTPHELSVLCKPFLEKDELKPPSYLKSKEQIDEWFELLVASFKDNLKTLSDITELAKPYFFEGIPDYSGFESDLAQTAAKEAIEFLLNKLDNVDELSLENANSITTTIRDHFKAQGYKPKDFLHPIRIALVAKHTGPPIPNMLALLGKARTSNRLKHISEKT